MQQDRRDKQYNGRAGTADPVDDSAHGSMPAHGRIPGDTVLPTFTPAVDRSPVGQKISCSINDLRAPLGLGTGLARLIADMRLSIERLWRVVPVPVIVLDRMPGCLIGLSMGLFVIVRSDYARDRPTMIHELEHCKQFWRGGVLLHMLRYYASRAYRLRVEVEAFRAELDACEPEERAARLDDAARALATGYHIGLDASTCRRHLTCSHPFDAAWPTSPRAAPRRPTPSPAAMVRSTNSTER